MRGMLNLEIFQEATRDNGPVQGNLHVQLRPVSVTSSTGSSWSCFNLGKIKPQEQQQRRRRR